MIRKTIGKANLSITNIGTGRFWFGIVVGLAAAVVLGFFFSYSREALRFMTQVNADLLILSMEDHWFYNYFYAALAVTLGLSITVCMWLGNRTHKRKKDKRYKLYGITLILVNFWVVILAISRVGSIFPIMPQGLLGYDNHLDFSVEFRWMFIAIPIVIFLLVWSCTRMIYKSLKWISFSIPICLLTIFVLARVVYFDQSIVNDSYFPYYEERLEYVDAQLKIVADNYDLHFDDETINALKKWHTENSLAQMKMVNTAFEYNASLSLETIIIAKIIQHNMKRAGQTGGGRWDLETWHFPQPKQVYWHLNKVDYARNEAKELVAILTEQITQWNCDDFDHTNRRELSYYEDERLYFSNHLIPRQIMQQLKSVRDSLVNNADFMQHGYQLPEVLDRSKK